MGRVLRFTPRAKRQGPVTPGRTPAPALPFQPAKRRRDLRAANASRAQGPRPDRLAKALAWAKRYVEVGTHST